MQGTYPTLRYTGLLSFLLLGPPSLSALRLKTVTGPRNLSFLTVLRLKTVLRFDPSLTVLRLKTVLRAQDSLFFNSSEIKDSSEGYNHPLLLTVLRLKTVLWALEPYY